MSEQAPNSTHIYPAERPKAFVDAVVAIAMTLLILPLMESVGEAADAGEGASALEWLLEHSEQLVSFALSFVIIAMFWLAHHRMFKHVERVTSRLLQLMMAWMFSIVWLPVATALSGQMPGDDPSAKVAYIGSMIATALLSCVIRMYLHRHLELGEFTSVELRSGMAVDLSLAVLFALALTISLLVPAVGYYSMLILFASGPTQVLARRLLRANS